MNSTSLSYQSFRCRSWRGVTMGCQPVDDWLLLPTGLEQPTPRSIRKLVAGWRSGSRAVADASDLVALVPRSGDGLSSSLNVKPCNSQTPAIACFQKQKKDFNPIRVRQAIPRQRRPPLHFHLPSCTQNRTQPIKLPTDLRCLAARASPCPAGAWRETSAVATPLGLSGTALEPLEYVIR